MKRRAARSARLSVPALIALLAVLLLALVACGEKTVPPQPVDETTADGAGTTVEITPTFRTDGPIGAVPEELQIRFPRDVFSSEQYGSSFEETELELEPTVDGKLRLADLSQLVFKPTVAFVPGTEYRATLGAVETADGLVEPPAEDAWTFTFKTPELELSRLDLLSMEERGDRAKVALVFTGAVAPEEVRRKARFELVLEDGKKRRIADVRFQQAPDLPHVVHAYLSNRGLDPKTRLELELDAGVLSRADDEHRAGEAKATIAFRREPNVQIVDVYRAESDNGFYLQVICDDQALEKNRYGFWSQTRRRYFEISARCLPDEELAREMIRIVAGDEAPEVEWSLTPGRGGFRLFGDFDQGEYELDISQGLRTVDGGVLPSRYKTSFEIPQRSPRVDFVSEGRYLPRHAWQLLPVRHLNVEEARLEVRHVPSENLVFWMSDETSERADERTSNLIATARLPLRGSQDVEATSYLDLSSHVPQDVRGLLELRLRGAAGGQDTARILLTDLHLVAKRTAAGEVAVWALDNDTLEPAGGTEVALVRKSGYVLARCETNRDGACRLLPPQNPTDKTPPFALLARRADDLTYLKFADLEVAVQEERVSGEPYRGGRKYRAAVYTDRGVYRPGETAHLAAILRGEELTAPDAGMPVQAKVIDPRGKPIRSATLTANAAGFLTLDLEFPDFASTGRYEVELAVAEKTIGETSFQIEEFVPERMKVEAEAVTANVELGDEVRLAVAARYLFGGVPKNHRVELLCELEPGRFSPEENASFHYGVWRPGDGPERGLSLGTATGTLDEDGRTILACPGARAGGFAGPALLVARAAVFESGSGRTTVGRATVPVHPAAFYLGLSSGSGEVRAGNDLIVDGVVVDWQGQRTGAVDEVEVELVRLVTEYGWYFNESTGRWQNRRQERPVVEERRTVPVADGKFDVTFTPRSDAGAFLVRARSGNARTDLELDGRGRWYWHRPEEGDRTPEPGRATWLALDAPKLSRVGEKIGVRFEAPYPGRLLFTAETDSLLETTWRDVEAGPVSFTFEAQEFVPNIYLTAFLIKDPHTDGGGETLPQAYLPERAFGVVSVALEPEELTHDLALTAPTEVRSNSRLEVELDLGKTEGPTWATVAAVDEGILSLTRFESPDPFPAIFTRRALGVDTFETVGWTLLVPPASPTSTEAGDTGSRLGRVQPIKPVALWSGLVEVPEDGKVNVGFDVPSYRGALRVMAVTAGRERMGRADAEVLVRDPLVVQATLPRFLTAGDELRVPVFVTNMSGQRRDVRVELEATAAPVPGFDEAGTAPAPVEILGDDVVELPLADGGDDVAVFRLEALAPAGAAKLRVTVSSGELRSTEEVTVPLLPAGPKTRTVERIELEEGEIALASRLDGWVPLSERSTFWVTSQPYGDVLSHLKYLVRYPYGCIEQTSSTTRPLLFLGHLLPTIAPGVADPGEIEAMAQSGLDRLLSMQTPEGGFGYWPGAAQPTYWGTAYATQILLEGRELGFQVPKEALDDALDWMERQITHHYEKGLGSSDWYSSNAEPYFHLVLALADRPRKARIERLIEEIDVRSARSERKEHLYMLQAALYLAGDRRYEANLKSPDASMVSDERDDGWTFYSDRRRRGMMLSLMVDLFGRDEAAEPLVRTIVETLRAHPSRWYTTQELAWNVVALGKYAEAGAKSFAPPVLRADGRALTPEPAGPGAASGEHLWNVARASEYGSLTLDVPEKDDGKLYLILSSEGVREDAELEVGGEGLILRRRFRDAEGAELDPGGAGHRLGDLVYVELTLTNSGPERVTNIALVDRIPAGWEIENPRLGRGSAPEWVPVDQLWGFDHMDLRDDRLEVFGHLEKGQSATVVYAVRATTAGRFTIPPVEAEAMYDPRIWARQDGAEIFIDGPWVE